MLRRNSSIKYFTEALLRMERLSTGSFFRESWIREWLHVKNAFYRYKREGYLGTLISAEMASIIGLKGVCCSSFVQLSPSLDVILVVEAVTPQLFFKV